LIKMVTLIMKIATKTYTIYHSIKTTLTKTVRIIMLMRGTHI